MAREYGAAGRVKKKINPTERKMTTALFMLRAAQLGISVSDLDLLSIGMVQDMYVEMANDEAGGYARIATQDDFDKFAGC